YKHKKQSGGHGQYAEVFLRISPIERSKGFEFKESIVGGAIPKQYIPGVEKGIREAMESGVIAKYPVVDIKAELYDGSFHAVDSSELAFKLASASALKMAMQIANPVLLEPVMNVRIYVDKQYMGDVMNDITARRGKVLKMEGKDENRDSGINVISAQIPSAELVRYSIDLTTLTQNKAMFEMSFSHYEPVTGKIAEKVIEERKKFLEE
ncbi:MAG TPA: elongation factor G, partial [Spirochaetota bacterium]|nr:elongation factor G [Spirochaetota bacterium]